MSQPNILIIGGGAFGTSAAYHLFNRGYSNITVLDRFSAPSRDAAATDLNKIIRYDYPNPLYTKLGPEAMDVWKNPNMLFQGLFHGTERILAAHDITRDFLQAAYGGIIRAGKKEVRWLSTSETKKTWPRFTGPFKEWRDLWSPEAGWVPSGQPLHRFAIAAQANGVEYVSGDAGYVKQSLFNAKSEYIGALAANCQPLKFNSNERDGDTRDINFRICAYPGTKNLFIGTGGSGHGFKFMPMIGEYIDNTLEGKLNKGYAELWKWRSGATPVKTGREPRP
ncbi:uncharacterized protein BDV17DRAFT_291224 [Aspergillus undulatus]|uniref:uncharacterized protein n=1 Tax=Aspergillus undulatus TaxID=1810928 RepID=UPI003CCD5B8E